MPQIIAGGVSVIIPAYNRAALIEQTLSSLLNQTLPAEEIIVVDDGSSDGTEDAARAAFHRWESEKVKGKRWEGGKLPDFKVIRQANAGPGAARNRGFAESSGEFVHFFDSDDIAAPNKHEVQVRALQESGADIAYGPWVKGYMREHEAGPLARSADGLERSMKLGASTDGVEQGSGRYSFEPENLVAQQEGLPKGDLIKQLLVRWSVVPQTCLFRRAILDKAGDFPEDLVYAEDQEFFLRCLLAGAHVVHTPQTITFYRSDNTDKLTASPERAMMRFDNLARLLMRIRIDCLLAGLEPLEWFGFRLRCEGALHDLEAAGGGEMVAAKQLRRYLEASWYPRFFYSAAGKILQWRGGMKKRVQGHRSDSSYRCGPMTREQMNLFPTT
jgi:glycosyltransferase involved in cell wall biosynthesis